MASELKVDKFTGVTTAGSIDVVGEGNSTTTNLQQGLTKAWIQVDGSASDATADLTGVRGSFNFSSVTDNSTGNHSFAFSNNMNAADYAISNGANYLLTHYVQNIASPANTYATTGFDVECWNSNYSAPLDYDYVSADIKGDLA